MKIFKDFWYLFFCVEIDGKINYFLNYRRAKEYYWAQAGVSKAYYGWHILRKYQCLHMVLEYRPTCQNPYDRWSSNGNDNMVINQGLSQHGWTAEAEI